MACRELRPLIKQSPSFRGVICTTVTPVFLMALFQPCSSLITKPPVKGGANTTHQFANKGGDWPLQGGCVSGLKGIKPLVLPHHDSCHQSPLLLGPVFPGCHVGYSLRLERGQHPLWLTRVGTEWIWFAGI